MRCRICDNAAGNTRHTAREMMFGTREPFEYVECTRCGCVQIAAVPPDLGRHYPPDYYSLAGLDAPAAGGLLHAVRRRRDRFAVTGRGLAGRIAYSLKPAAALRSLAARQQDVREDERTRIAREIHDTLGQALTALKLQLSAAQEAAAKDAPALKARLQETTLMVDDLVKCVRRIATDLRPPILDQLGLPAAVEWLAQDFTRRTGIRCETAIRPTDGAISDELATSLFRIVQEALTNVLRHAGATRVDIELGVKSGCVALEINDHGTGITEAGTIGPGSLGILGMRERAPALGRVLEVAPRAGRGTRVAAWFPPQPVAGARDPGAP